MDNYNSNNNKNSGIMHDKRSIQSLKTVKDDGSIKEVKEEKKKIEDNEKLLIDQLQNIKEELKDTRKKMENYKKVIWARVDS